MRTNRPMRQSRVYIAEGAPAARIDVEQQLRRSVLACLLWEKTFYEEGEDIAERIQRLAAQLDPITVEAIAIEARSVQHLRHVPLLLALSLARRAAPNTAHTIEQVIQRADEITEFVSLYFGGHDRKATGQKLSNQTKQGLTAALRKFDEYQLAKYNRQNAIKLSDVLRLVRPKPASLAQAALWGRLRRNELTVPDTWEVALSTGESKLDAWTRLLHEGKLGALALLRNLRNMGEAGVDQTLIKSAVLAAKADRVLPFRFITAARYAPWLEQELEQLMFRNLADHPKLSGRTILLVDASTSMSWKISEKSELSRYDAAVGLAMLLREVCEQTAVVRYNYQVDGIFNNERGFDLQRALRRPGGGTNTNSAKLQCDAMGYDRLVIITDEQSAEQLSAPVRGTRGYVINVATDENGIGYGPWTHVDGWSESIVTYIQRLEVNT
jgi:60 kDa SS-A/Ro ribonucleoprotein